MDSDLESNLQEVPQPNLGHPTRNLAAGNSNMAAACILCQRVLSFDDDSGDVEFINICGGCKFLLLEDHESPIHDIRQRGISRVRRRRRFGSSESMEDIFAQRFSHMINLARANQTNVAENENQQRSSSRTSTPSNSRRWRRVVSDTESDGFDSLYGESESNVSVSGSRLFHGESDIISYSAASYGGDSDASVDGHSLLDTEIFAHPDGESDFDSDTDIDPMHAGLNQSNLDDDDDDEWEDAGDEENIFEALGMALRGSSNGDSGASNWQRRLYSPEIEGTVRWRIRGGRLTYDSNSRFANLEESEITPNVGNSGDYLDSRGLRELLEHLAETDISRQGAPPAAVSFVNTLPRVVINAEHDKQGDLACAICKDSLKVGTIVNQLPCSHLYHPCCILPWLSARNSCPLCRYELPTDDLDYEERKRNTGNGLVVTHEIEQQDSSEDSSSGNSSDAEAHDARGNIDIDRHHSSRENARGRRFFFLAAAAAAPIVSLVGIALVLWFGNSLRGRRQQRTGLAVSSEGARQLRHGSGNCLPNQMENRSRRRRWWSLF